MVNKKDPRKVVEFTAKGWLTVYRGPWIGHFSFRKHAYQDIEDKQVLIDQKHLDLRSILDGAFTEEI